MAFRDDFVGDDRQHRPSGKGKAPRQCWFGDQDKQDEETADRLTRETERRTVLVTELLQGDERKSLSFHPFLPNKHLDLINPQLKAEILQQDQELLFLLRAEALARFVEMELIRPIPNDCLAFGPSFPADVSDRIAAAVEEQFQTEEGKALWGDGFYGWTDVTEIDDSYYDSYRELLGLRIPDRSTSQNK